MKKLLTALSILVCIPFCSGCEKTEPVMLDDGWELVCEAGNDEQFNSLYFVDDENGWAVGDKGLMLRTTDGGDTWKQQKSETKKDLRCIWFTDDRNGWTAGSHGAVRSTADGGETWATSGPEDGWSGTCMDICFTDTQNGWLVNNLGSILHTEDGGKTWTAKDGGTERALSAVFFIDRDTGWMVSERTVLRTTNGGDTWDAAPSWIPDLPSGTIFTDIFFIDENEGWITTTTAAGSSAVEHSPLLHSLDGGISWGISTHFPELFLNKVLMTDRENGWLLSSRFVYSTDSGGRSAVSRLHSRDIPFVDLVTTGGYVFVLDSTGNIYRGDIFSLLKITGKPLEIGTHVYYSSQSVSGDTLIAAEYGYGSGLQKQHIIAFDLRTGEKEIIKEIPLDHRIEPPAIWNNMIIWSECTLPDGFLEAPQKDFETLDWNICFRNLETDEETQITKDEHAQRWPGISDGYIVWLDGRHEEDRDYPHYYDIYAYSLRTGEEIRITAGTTAEGYDLGISDGVVVWTDCRNDSPATRIQEKPPIFNHDIYCYDLTTGEERQVTDNRANDNSPAIDNGKIVWARQFGTINKDIYLYEIDTGTETRISSSGYASQQFPPSISGNVIVWGDSRLTHGQSAGDCFGVNTETGTSESGSSEIFLFDLDSREEILLIASEGKEFLETVREQEITTTVWQVLNNPVIRGDYVIYTDERQIDPVTYVVRLEY